MASIEGAKRSGVCSNFGNCSLADSRATVEVTAGKDFVCTECGRPLLLKGGEGKGRGGSTGLILGAIVLVLVLVGWIVWSMIQKMTAAPEAPPPASVVVPAPEPPAQPPAAERPAPPAERPSGDCSSADESAGLCTRQTQY